LLAFVSSGLPLTAQSHPIPVPKILYSCDTAGILGCFPLMRNGEKSYALGNVSKASLVGEEAAIAVEKFDGTEIVINYKDIDKTATFSGQIAGNRVQGVAVSNASAGGKMVKVGGRWTALAVIEPPDFTQIKPHMPLLMNVCQSNDDSNSSKDDCFTWSWDSRSPVFAGNLLTVERFDNGGVVILGMNQHGTGGLAAYTGKIESGRIQGTVDYYSGDGHTWTGKWTATFMPISPATHK
jgi:hypothetical protein